MIKQTLQNSSATLLVIMLASLLTACTSVNPYTGQTEVNQAQTAALISGLALAGAAYAAKRDDDDDDDRYNSHYSHDPRYGRVYHPARKIDCFDSLRKCYKHNGKYSKSWTRRVYHRHASTDYDRY